MNDETTTTRWGRVRFGAGRMPALAIAAVVGVPLAALIGLAGGALRPEEPVLFGVVLAVCVVSPCIALVWALVVDRATLRGAPKDPEESVESRWYDRAASGAFTGTLTAAGLGLAVVAIGRLSFQAGFALLAVVLFAMASFAPRYLIAARRG